MWLFFLKPSLLRNQTSLHLLYALPSLSRVQVLVLVLVFRFVVSSSIALLCHSNIVRRQSEDKRHIVIVSM